MKTFLERTKPAGPDDPIFKQGAMMYTIPPGWAEKRRAAMAKQQEEKEKTDEVIDTVTSEQDE